MLVTYNGPALDLPLGGFGPKVNKNERGLEYFIPTEFGEYPSSDSVVQSDHTYTCTSAPPTLFTLINK